jgi:hypothetical protein
VLGGLVEEITAVQGCSVVASLAKSNAIRRKQARNQFERHRI